MSESPRALGWASRRRSSGAAPSATSAGWPRTRPPAARWTRQHVQGRSTSPAPRAGGSARTWRRLGQLPTPSHPADGPVPKTASASEP